MKKGIGCLILFLVLGSPFIAMFAQITYKERKAARMGKYLDNLVEHQWEEVFLSAKDFHSMRWVPGKSARERVSVDDLPETLRPLGFDHAIMDDTGLSFSYGGGFMQGGASVTIYLEPKNDDPAHVRYRGKRRNGIVYLRSGQDRNDANGGEVNSSLRSMAK